MKIAVAGATGRVGRHVVEVLAAQAHDVVPISRSGGVDVITGEGLAAALAGVECIVDVATGPSPEQQAATEFFTTAARNLQQAGEQAGVRRIVVVSIIGTERFAGGYGAAKVAHEQATLAGPIPVSVLGGKPRRAGQAVRGAPRRPGEDRGRERPGRPGRSPVGVRRAAARPGRGARRPDVRGMARHDVVIGFRCVVEIRSAKSSYR